MSIASQQVLQTGRNKVLQLIWISLTSSLPLCFQTYQLLPQALDGCLRPSWCWRRSCPSLWNDPGFGIVPKAWQFGCLDLWPSWICLETLSRFLCSIGDTKFGCSSKPVCVNPDPETFCESHWKLVVVTPPRRVSSNWKEGGRTPLLTSHKEVACIASNHTASLQIQETQLETTCVYYILLQLLQICIFDILPFSPSEITSLKLVFETTPLPSFRSSDPGEQWRLVPNPLLTMDEFLEGKADKWRDGILMPHFCCTLEIITW